MRINLDLHIHSRYSGATSARMDLPTIAREAAKKGVDVVGTGDCLHPRWLKEIGALRSEDGLFFHDKTAFAPTVEVEDSSKVHHLVLVPDLAKAYELRKAFAAFSSNIDTDGRPNLAMTGKEIADVVLEAGCMLGPSHAFTPWTGIYAHHRSLEDCYGEHAEKVCFVELGLSADSDYADRIEELRSRTFLSNSDAHSPWSNRLAREFNQVEVETLSFWDVERSLRRKGGCRPTLNVGFYPDEGKYNRTACTRCYRQYPKEEMEERLGRCGCGGLIKLGVRDRVDILSDSERPVHPDHRPPYLHLIPLAEIIAMALSHKSVYTSGVQRCWNELIAGGSEIWVLLEADLSRLEADPAVIMAIEAFRSGGVVVTPGGGGRYGQLALIREELDEGPPQAQSSQRSLMDF